MNSKHLLPALLLILFSMMAKAQTKYYVKSSVTTSGAGTSWESAYKTLQEALTTATAGDQIWVAAGTYYPDEGGTFADNDRGAHFAMKEGVEIYGGFAGNEPLFTDRNWKTNVTILSGDIDRNDGSDFSNTAGNARGIIMNNNNGLTAAAVLDGFTISDGNADDTKFYNIGGGMENTNVSPTIVNCSFLRNKASFGGGAMYNTDSAPTIINCIFAGNSAHTGGAIRNYNSDATIINCVFSGNKASQSGGGMYISESSPTLINCTFSGNNAPIAGAIYVFSSSIANLKNCIFWGNSSEVGFNPNSSITYSHCLIQGADLTAIGTGNLNGTSEVSDPSFISAPNFTDAPTTAGNLRLSFCSPVRNRGNDANNSSLTDLDGNPRKTGTIDIGAYEIQSSASAQILYVKTDGDDTKDGQSWPNAFKTLQKALQQACSGTQIWVAAGTYYPDEGGSSANNDRTATFSTKDGVAIYGGFGGDETLLSERRFKNHPTTLSGDIDQNDGSNFANNESNSYHVLTGMGGFVDGFIISGGNANGSSFPNNNHIGGGITITVAMMVSNCSLIGNTATNGGGICTLYGATLTNCSFLGNKATGSGGGVYNFGARKTSLVNCSFSGNKAADGGGIYINRNTDDTELINCSISGNYATSSGGGIYNTDAATATRITNCIIWGNNSEVRSTGTPIYVKTIVKGLNLGARIFDGTQNPLFVLQPDFTAAPTIAGDLHLQACSPVLNQGNNAENSTTTDPDGNPRIYNNGIVDLGAYEYQGSSAALTTTVGSTSPSTCGGTNGSITLSGFLANTGYSVSYTKGATNVPAANFTADAGGVITLTNLSAGSYTNILATYGACVSTAANATLNDPVPPIANIGGTNSPICAGGNASFTVSGTSGATLTYTLTGVIGNQTLLLNGSNQTITANNANTNVTLTLISVTKNNCSVSLSATATVAVTPLPTAVISYVGTPYCKTLSTAAVTLTGTNAYTGGSYSSTAGLSINPTTGEINPSTSTAGTYNVTYTIAGAGGCAQVQANTSITITALPTANITYTGTPFCKTLTTAAVTLTGTNAYTGGSYSSTAGLSINSTTGEVNPSTSTAGTYQVTYTIIGTGGCAQVQANTSLTITPLPTANISYAGTPFCKTLTAGAVTLTGINAYTGGNYSSTAGLTINSTTGEINPSASIAGTYSVTYTIAAAGGCAQVQATASVTITALPTATITYTNSPFCKTLTTAAVTLTGTNAYTGGSYSSTAGLSINPTTGEINPSASTAGNYQVTYTIAAAGGCAQVQATASVTITALPTATISYAGTPFCKTLTTAAVTLTGINAYTGGSYSSTAGLSINPTTGEINPSASTAGNYQVTYTIAAAGGCGQVQATASVTINPIPTANISGTVAVCKDAPASDITFTGSNGTAPYTFTYKINNGGNLTVTTTNGNSVTRSQTTAGAGTFTYTLVSVSDNNNCAQSQTGSATITVLAPSTPTSPTGGTVSLGQSINLTANGCSGEGFTLLWYKSVDNSQATMPISPTTTTLYYARCQQSSGQTSCLSPKTANVTVVVGQRIFVNAANANPSPDGTSWAKAFASLQSALTVAGNSSYSPVEVWVAQGTYTPGALRKDAFVIPSGVKVYGGFVGSEDSLYKRNWKTRVTTLSGEIGTVNKNDNVHHVVLFSATNDSTRLDGFSIRGGYAEYFAGNQNTNLNDPEALTSGGGILAINKSKGVITHCILTDNRASAGGGIHLRDTSQVRISQTIIWGNEANFGGGIYVLGSSTPFFENVMIVNNKGLGAGLYVNRSQPVLIHCTIASNKDESSTAGGILNSNASTTVKNSILWGNTGLQSNAGSAISYSLVEGGYSGMGNKNQDPLFVSANSVGLAPMGGLGDYHVQPCSPAIDAANNSEAVLVDLEGNPRPFPSGIGIADMGVYESQTTGTAGPNHLEVTENITSGTVLKTGGWITATNQISNATVIYQATKSVTLQPGFSATATEGKNFQALIGGCP